MELRADVAEIHGSPTLALEGRAGVVPDPAGGRVELEAARADGAQSGIVRTQIDTALSASENTGLRYNRQNCSGDQIPFLVNRNRPDRLNIRT